MRKIYQIYIEYIFLLNFVFLFCIWELTSTILACSVTQKRIVFVSLLGAIVNCICFLLPLRLWYRLLTGALFTGILGIKLIAPQIKECKAYIKYLVAALEMAVLLGGSIALLQKFILNREFSILQMAGVTIGLSLCIKILLRYYILPRKKLYYSVCLWCDGNEYSMKALLDTGNSLIEPISKKAVCLVGKDYFDRQWEKEGERKEFQPQRFRVIPYHAVGTENGILHGYEMDRLIIYTDERKVEILKPMIGISEVPIGSRDSYQMILQPELLSEGEK